MGKNVSRNILRLHRRQELVELPATGRYEFLMSWVKYAPNGDQMY